MRRIGIRQNYSRTKIRGIKRRLNALDRWSQSFAGYFPTKYSERKYWNYKIPVLDILVNRPATTSRIQARCINSLIQAANHILAARPPDLSYAKVTILITYPNMFGSEICIFFKEDYVNSFFNRSDRYQSLTLLDKEKSLTTKLGVRLPEIYEEIGFEFKIYNDAYDDALDGFNNYSEQWWSIREK